MYAFLSWQYATAAIGISFLSLAFYRLTLHPLSSFPGPKLAAITRFYEGYYDIIQGGQYTFKIAKLHKQYGPIIRISPYELHVSDPAFFEVLYRQDAHYDKHAWALDAMGATGSMLFTIPHSVHKARRQPLSGYFSKNQVAARQDMIHRHLDKLHRRVLEFVKTRKTLDLGAAATAVARDVANDFILAKSYNSLDRDDFDSAMVVASQGAGPMWHLSKFVRGLFAAVRALLPLMMKIGTSDQKVFFRFLQQIDEDTKRLMKMAALPPAKEGNPRTIVHEIMNSKLPPSEKKFERVVQDVSTVTGAGYETTASVLRLILFHVFSDSEILGRLRAEIASTGAKPGDSLDLKTLEQLQYLTGIVKEGLRLSPAIATRMGRVSPDKDIFYDQWRVPAGTAISMTLILMHTDETLFPNPHQFNPERWLGDSKLRTDRAFAPFSRGTRICLGMYLAWAELYTVVAELAHRYDFHFPDASAEDFRCVSDQFGVGTRGRGILKATVTLH